MTAALLALWLLAQAHGGGAEASSLQPGAPHPEQQRLSPHQVEAARTLRPEAPPLTLLQTPHFDIRHTALGTTRAHRLRNELEEARAKVEALLGRPWPGRTEVRVAGTTQEVTALAPRGSTPPRWAVALAWPQLNLVLVNAQTLATPQGPTTLQHELVHVALGALAEDWPRWFQEGLAQALTDDTRFRVDVYTALARALASRTLYSLDELSQGFPEDPQGVTLAYAQSAAFVEYLRARHGQAAFERLLDEAMAGERFQTAFGKAFRSPLSLEEERWRQSLPARYPLWALFLDVATPLLGLTGVLVLAGHLFHRRRVLAARAEALRQQHLEDVAHALLARARWPANDDVAPLPWPEPDWRVTAFSSAPPRT